MSDQKSQLIRCLNCHSLHKHKLKYKFDKFNLFICSSCSNGFIDPVPKDMGKYYPDNYWKIPGLSGRVKKWLYDFFQTRRAKWVRTYLKEGSILDVGAGEALFAKKMSGFEVVSIDFPDSKIKNPNVLKTDFLKWRTSNKFDAIVFWESLEHVPDPGRYLEKSYQLLKNNGLIFIESPSFDSFESKLFSKDWYHLDPPRHLAHFSYKGLGKILRKQNFERHSIEIERVFAPEYIYIGFLISLLNLMGFKPVESHIKKDNPSGYLLLAVTLMPIAIVIESLLYLFGHSPIMLAVARKSR